MMKKTPVLSLMVLALSLQATAQQFQTALLATAADKLHLDTALLARPGLDTLTVNGQRVVVRVGEQGMVEHIGLPLFNAGVRTLQPSPIYDYLEQAALGHRYHLSDNTLLQKELRFVHGSWDTLLPGADTLACHVYYVADRHYRVEWLRQEQPVAVVTFPVDYELLANSNRREQERNFLRDLQAFASREHTAALPVLDSLALSPTAQATIAVAPGQSHIIPAISNSLYISLGKEGGRRLLMDNRYPAESMANMLLQPAATNGQTSIELHFVLSDYRRDTLTVTLTDLLLFAQSQGCTPFFGYEGTTGGKASATLLLANTQSGYDHILHVTAPTRFIGTPGQTLQAHVYLFTPMANVKSLFGKNIEKSKSLILWK